MSALDRLIDKFVYRLEDAQKEAVIQQIERRNPEAAQVLRRLRNMEKRTDEFKREVDDLIAMLRERRGASE